MWGLLRQLFAKESLSPEDVREPPDEFACAEAPDWLLQWKGWLLPHGGSYSGRLPLWEKIACATAAVYPLSQTRSPQPSQVMVSETLSQRLWSVLREAFPERLLSVPEICRDGLPFELVVSHRKPYRGVRAWCNLGDALDLIRPWENPVVRSWSDLAESQVSAGRAFAPVFRLGMLLLDLSLDSPHESAQPGATLDRRGMEAF